MNNKTNILYISTLCSPKVWDYIFNTSKRKPGQSAQKFHRLLVDGFSMHNDKCNVEALTSVPVVFKSHKRKIWTFKKENLGNVTYHHIPFINLPFIKEFLIFTYSFLRIVIWGFMHRGEVKIIVCDVLKMTPSVAAILASRFIRSKTIALVTDIPGLMIASQNSKSIKIRVYNRVVKRFIHSYDGYVLLTKQMNELVNAKKRPFMIMEGLVSRDMVLIENNLNTKDEKRIMLYAGGVYEKYGIKDLILAFMKLPDQNTEFHIYGNGDMVSEIKRFQKTDPRVVYKGIVANDDVVKAQIKATILVNPRPSNLKLSSFSFPSKNMEYMVSGTPVVTTALPGMPDEYKEYVFLFNDESVDGMFGTLTNIFQLAPSKLREKGQKAKEFVINKKSNYTQCLRIIEYIQALTL